MSRRGNGRRTLGSVGLVALLALVAASCGTRLPDEAFERQGELVAVDDETASRRGANPAGGVAEGDQAAAGEGGPEPAGGGPGAEGAEGGPAPGAEGGEGGPPPPGPAPPAGGGPNQASDVGVTETTIKLGNITAENGVLGDAFAPAVRGLRAWVQHVNATGGINGRKVELATCDDREDRSRSLECARRLVEQDKVFALVAVNTRALGGAAQYLHDQKVPVIGIPITNSYYRYPRFFSLYDTGYKRDGKTVGHEGNIMFRTGNVRWYKDTYRISKAAVFSYDIDESRQAGDAFAKGLELEGMEVARYTVSFAAPSFDQPVADMQRRGTELVMDAMDDGANRRLCDAMARRQFQPKVKVSTVVSFGEGVGKNYNETCRKIIHIGGESRPYTSAVPEVAAFRQAYAKYQPGLPMHQWALEAWAMGNMARTAIESMGPAPTRDGFVQFLNTMEPYTANGILVGTHYRPLDFSQPTMRDCFVISRWDDGKGGWVEASKPFPFCYPDAKVYGSPAYEQGN